MNIMHISREKLLELMIQNNIGDQIKRGPAAIFFVPETLQKTSKETVQAQTIDFSYDGSCVTAKSGDLILHIYALNELNNKL